MRPNRKIVLELLETGAPKITFFGDRISKRELARLLRATELEFRERVREYRRNKIKQKLEARKAVENNERTTSKNSTK